MINNPKKKKIENSSLKKDNDEKKTKQKQNKEKCKNSVTTYKKNKQNKTKKNVKIRLQLTRENAIYMDPRTQISAEAHLTRVHTHTYTHR